MSVVSYDCTSRRRLAGDPKRPAAGLHRRCGAALLEVVVALSILLVAMSVVGLVFRNGQHYAELTDQMTRAMMLTERLLAEIDTGILELEEREQVGWFGDEGPPNMAWRVAFTPHEDMDDLLDIDIEIHLGDPEGEDEEHQLILFTRVQRPKPRGIDFEKDFGLDQDQIDQLTDLIPGGAAVLDPTDFDPRLLASLDLDELVDLLPTLIQAFGTSLGGGQLDGILQAVQSGDLGAIQDLGQQAIQGAGDGAGQGGTGGS
ncbi:MAG: hypothetical protein ABII12_11305 [Planctomycetota bacterium]